jgi:hypothetical protein
MNAAEAREKDKLVYLIKNLQDGVAESLSKSPTLWQKKSIG